MLLGNVGEPRSSFGPFVLGCQSQTLETFPSTQPVRDFARILELGEGMANWPYLSSIACKDLGGSTVPEPFPCDLVR